MTDKTEEQVAKDRAAIEAMRNAKANMDTALSRIDSLERALDGARSNISRLKTYISPGVYTYPTGSANITCHVAADEMMAAITKVLGK